MHDACYFEGLENMRKWRWWPLGELQGHWWREEKMWLDAKIELTMTMTLALFGKPLSLHGETYVKVRLVMMEEGSRHPLTSHLVS